MCGIAGFVDLAQGISCGALEAMNNVARYRGPDDEGYVFFSRTGAPEIAFGSETAASTRTLAPAVASVGELVHRDDRVIGLAHRRLSIIDVAPSGHQPMIDEATGCALVFNGEIYNYPEVRAKLEGIGAVFSTESDTEVLLRAYLAWGEGCLEELNGMWGFALWDPRSRLLFCARDRLGAKPFHWWRSGKTLFGFGSEIKQICQNPLVPRRLNQSYLAANVVYGVSDFDDQTPFEGIFQLEPGHRLTLVINRDLTAIESFSIEPYWLPEVRPQNGVSLGEWTELVQREVARACAWRMRSDVPIAMLLSGGLDSSCLTAEVADRLKVSDPQVRLATFTTSYRGQEDCDEANFAQLVNESKGCDGHILEPVFEEGTMGEAFSNLVWHMEGRCGISHLGAMKVAQAVGESGYKVLLNGQCGDETMFGYERYYAFYLRDLVRRGQWRAAVREFKLAVRNSKLSLKTLAAQLAYFNAPRVRSTVRLKDARTYCQEAFLSQLDRRGMEEMLFPRSLDQLLETELHRTQLTHIVRMDDRYSMAASVETRIPFMDYQYVELACSIPPDVKIHEGWTKYLIRRAFEGRLPDEVVWRKNKFGFPAPRELWLSQIPDDFIADLLDHPRTASLFDIGALRSADKTSRAMENFLWVELLACRFDATV